MTLPTANAPFENDTHRDIAWPESRWLASSAEPVTRGDVRGPGSVRFRTISGFEFEITVPELKLALYELGRVWPHALLLEDLAVRVAEHLGKSSNAAELSRLLFDSPASTAIRAFAQAPRSVRAPSQQPQAIPVARLEAARGTEVTNLHDEPVKVEVEFDRKLLMLLDGTRDREALARLLAGESVGASRCFEELERDVEAGLERLARRALLIA